MKLLFDTHAFIWWVSSSAKLSPHALALCHDQTNSLLLSVVSAWEIQIKNQLGKLQLNMPLPHIIANQQHNRLEILSVNLDHVLALDTLPMHHKDPFDRLLIAQANVENAILISHDAIFAQYPVNVRW
jgi:PIN domain nuclease of toxin-antitoxin system